MQFHRALAVGADLEAAARDAAARLRDEAGPAPFDLVVVFASARYGPAVDRLPVLLHEELAIRNLLGCSGGVIVDEAHAEAGRSSLALLAGRMPGARVDVAAVAPGDLPSPDAGPAAWRALLPARTDAPTGMLVLGEPFHGDVRALLAGLDFAFPDVVKIGGVASGSRHPEGHVLFCGRSTHRTGAVVAAFGGDVEIATVVASGCRPFGRAGRITKTKDRRLLAIDDQPARVFVREQLAALSAAERDAAHTSPLMLGIAPDPWQANERDDELLVRNILGIDAEGHLVVGEHLPAGRTVRLLMRDAAAGERDLRRRLAAADCASASGALMCQCIGRDGADHAAFAALAGAVPMVGFHGNGEIGPAANGTHVHAFTTVFALFRARSAP